MIKSWVACFVAVLFILMSCSKGQDGIDVSQQVSVDYNGNLISGEAKGQWVAAIFTTQEQNLFNGLDTANLTGTTEPDSVAGSSTIFPNPFSSVAALVFSFSSGFNGQVEFKFVVVDTHLNIKDKGAYRIQANPNVNYPSLPSNSDFIHLSPNIPEGKYRIYFTLSAESNPHFYRSWGNIQKAQ
jgi:hypothetical protein